MGIVMVSRWVSQVSELKYGYSFAGIDVVLVIVGLGSSPQMIVMHARIWDNLTGLFSPGLWRIFDVWDDPPSKKWLLIGEF